MFVSAAAILLFATIAELALEGDAEASIILLGSSPDIQVRASRIKNPSDRSRDDAAYLDEFEVTPGREALATVWLGQVLQAIPEDVHYLYVHAGRGDGTPDREWWIAQGFSPVWAEPVPHSVEANRRYLVIGLHGRANPPPQVAEPFRQEPTTEWGLPSRPQPDSDRPLTGGHSR